jgi:NADH-quinone oxidoreductase subunit G
VTDVADAPTETPPDPNAVAITVNGRAVTARKGELVIAAAERAGEYIPRFCYHPRMSSVGMCRQCLVEIDTGRGPALQPSCMITVAPDMAVTTDSPIALRAQEGILELLLANHPLDCPVCDKGGECPLQDQAFSHGPGESRYVEEKRHFEKPIPLSEHVLLDRERCILCDRCTRFADEVAGDKLIHFIDRGNATQVNTFPGDPFSSYFAGNTVQICPVGALTAKPYRFKARPWDLKEVTSTCTGCASGCRISVHSSRDELLRVQGVDVESVNHGWLCDKGRFSFQHVDDEGRLGAPLVRTAEGGAKLGSDYGELPWNSAMALAKELFEHALEVGGPASIGIVGGARLTNESAFAWAQLADALGVQRRDAQLGDGLPPEILGLPRATINDAASAATVIVVGPDLKEELGVLYLRLRGAVDNGYRGNQPKLIEIAPKFTGLTPYAWRSAQPKPGTTSDIAALLGDPAVTDQLATGPVVVVAGRGNLAASEDASLGALQAVLAALPAGADVKVLPALRRGNVVGALQLGLAPATPDQSTTATLQAAADGKLELLVLLGADPLSDCPDGDLAGRGLAGARRVLALDTFLTPSSRQADLVLPVAAFGEQNGTTTNIEGRVARVVPSVTVHGTARPDWMIAADLGRLLGHDVFSSPAFTSAAGLTSQIAATVPAYAGVTPEALHDVEGVLAVRGDVGRGTLPEPVAAEPPPNSYDFRLVVSRKLYDLAVATQHAPALAGLAIGAGAHVHPHDLDRVGVPSGTDVSVIGPEGSVVLPLIADASVARGTLWAPFNQPGASISAVVASTGGVTDVRIERLT